MWLLTLKQKIMKRITQYLILLISITVFSQTNTENACSPERPYGKSKIERFLTFHKSDYRQKSGTSNEKTSQIQLVSDSKACKALRIFIAENKTYKEFDQKTSNEEIIYFYETSNFFYVFWDYKPEFFRPRMGPPRPFLVVNKDFTQSWNFRL